MSLNTNLIGRLCIPSDNNMINVNNNSINTNNINKMKKKINKLKNISFETMLMYIEYVKNYIKSDVRLRLFHFLKKHIIHKYISNLSVCL